MKKILFPLLILSIILSMNCKEDEESEKGNNTNKLDYYPLEVTNVSYTVEKMPENYYPRGIPAVKIILSLTPPADNNFSHFIIREESMWFLKLDPIDTHDYEEKRMIDVYENTISLCTITVHPQLLIQCVNKSGKVSDGIWADIEYKWKDL